MLQSRFNTKPKAPSFLCTFSVPSPPSTTFPNLAASLDGIICTRFSSMRTPIPPSEQNDSTSHGPPSCHPHPPPHTARPPSDPTLSAPSTVPLRSIPSPTWPHVLEAPHPLHTTTTTFNPRPTIHTLKPSLLPLLHSASPASLPLHRRISPHISKAIRVSPPHALFRQDLHPVPSLLSPSSPFTRPSIHPSIHPLSRCPLERQTYHQKNQL